MYRQIDRQSKREKKNDGKVKTVYEYQLFNKLKWDVR